MILETIILMLVTAVVVSGSIIAKNAVNYFVSKKELQYRQQQFKKDVENAVSILNKEKKRHV